MTGSVNRYLVYHGLPCIYKEEVTSIGSGRL